MNVETLLARLSGVRRSGSGWTARCPAHNDRSASLSVREGHDGRLLLHCFAGCPVESICESLRIRVSDLFAERGAARERKPEIVRHVEQQIADLRSRLTRADCERPVTVIVCDPANPDTGLARALALSVEGEVVQAVLK